MATKARASDQPDPSDVTETAEDVEGHMLLNPSMSREMTSIRTREIERQIKDQQRARDAKAPHKR